MEMIEENDLFGSITINPSGSMDGNVNVIATKDYDIKSKISITNSKNISSEINIYSDFIVENPGWGIALYGHQKRGSINVKFRNDLRSKLTVKINNMMFGVIDIVQPPIHEQDFYSIEDAFVRQGVQTLNYGKEQTIQVGYSAQNKEAYRTLIKFNIENLPQNIGITQSKLRVYNSQLVASPQKLILYRVSSVWDEEGVTWRNQPYVNGIISTATVDNIGYVEFDVTNVIKDWHNQNEENYGFEIRSIDESTGNYLRFSSRESRFNEPELVVYYQDLTINSFGKSDIDSSLYVLNRNDLISSIRIPSYLSGEYLKSKLFVNRMDTKVSTLTISRPSIKSQLTARMNDERGIDATIDVRVKQLDEINTKLNISRPLIDSNVYVRFINEINSNVVIKKIEEKSITSSINVSRNNLNGFVSIPTIEYLDSNITIQGIEIKDISSKLFVSRNNILIDMYVRPFEDLLSNIDIQRKDSDTKKSFISISRKSIRTSINVKLHNDIDSTIVIRRKGVNDKISKIVINKPSISSSIKVFNFEVINSFVNVRVNDKKSINSKINIPFSSNLNSHISVKNHSSINSTLNINSGYFKSSITIRSYKDLNTKMIIRIRYINDIPSSITIGKINSYVFIT